MSARGITALAMACVLVACGPDPKRKTIYVDSYLDVLLLPDVTCDEALPICVSAFEVRLSHGGAVVAESCTDVVALLGKPAESIAELAILAGTEIAQEFPTSGLVGIDVRGHRVECTSTQALVFAGYTEVELATEDQQIYVPVSCAQPQEPCTPTADPTPTALGSP